MLDTPDVDYWYINGMSFDNWLVQNIEYAIITSSFCFVGIICYRIVLCYLLAVLRCCVFYKVF